jgi:hypothetical protein
VPAAITAAKSRARLAELSLVIQSSLIEVNLVPIKVLHRRGRLIDFLTPMFIAGLNTGGRLRLALAVATHRHNKIAKTRGRQVTNRGIRR